MSSNFSSILHSHFGFTSFRAGQEEAISSLLDKKHTLAIMPTGAGKSLIYQFTALQLSGLTLVISPLIALMKDQVDALNRKGIPATFINSAIPTTEQSQRLTQLAQGKYRLVYVAPERLRNVNFIRTLQNLTLSLLAVDEAHCISEWGHDFRPDYLHITEARKQLGNPLTVALTATATPKVQDDIVRSLGLPQNTKRIVTGFNRPNLTLEVKYTAGTKAKFRALNELLCATNFQFANGATIIYTGTRYEAEEVAEFVRVVCHLPAEHYHAGLPAEERVRIQERFSNGRTPVIVATNAFGMGIDRADVRQVIHYSVPGSLEAYYQEAGRAGRDGHPARAVLLYDPQDRSLREYFIQNSVVSPAELELLYRAIGNANGESWMTIEDFQRRTELDPVKIKVGLAELERIGALEHLGDDGIRMLLRKGTWNPSAVQQAAARSREHIRRRAEQLDHMIHYAESNSCRRRIILQHFGDHDSADAPVCCDNCETKKSLSAQTPHETIRDVKQMDLAERAALIILDAVRKLGRRQVGRTKLAQILKGSKAQDIQQFQYDKHVYYGKLAALKQQHIEDMIQELIALGYLKVVGGEYPVLKLTPQGESALQQKTPIPVKLPKGVSRNQIENQKAQMQAGGTVEYTAKLLADGLTPEQIAALRGLAVSTIYSHLAQLIAAGKISVQEVVSDEIRKQIEQAIERAGDTRFLSPIKALLPESVEFGMIRCVVAARDMLHPSETSETSRDLRIFAPSNEEIENLILECVKSLPAKLPRSGVAKLLVGSSSERVEAYQTHPLYNRLAGKSRAEVMIYIDKLLESGQLQKAENGYLILGQVISNTPAMTHHEVHPTPNPDPISAFLSSAHPRPLKGSWQAGFALDFHSSYTGSNWNRSGVGDLVYRLKYESDASVLPALIEQTRSLFAAHPEMSNFDVIVPVPASTPRAFSPVLEFCKALANAVGKSMLPCVIKTRQTKPQKEMRTLPQKRDNVAGAFALNSDITGKNILLVDDLFDSGATFEEITRLLRKHGAANINVLALTRTIHSDL